MKKTDINKIADIYRINQVKIEFTDKLITAWGDIATLVGKLLGWINFEEWVRNHVPVEERSNNSRGIYEKVLALFLIVLSESIDFPIYYCLVMV